MIVKMNNGRCCIPAVIRKRLGLKTGDKLEFIPDEDGFIMRPVKNKKDSNQEKGGSQGVEEKL